MNLQQHDVQNSRAKKTDYRSSLRGLRHPLGGGLSPPSPSLVTSLLKLAQRHVIRDSDTTFKVRRSKVNMQGVRAYCGGLPHSLFRQLAGNVAFWASYFRSCKGTELVGHRSTNSCLY